MPSGARRLLLAGAVAVLAACSDDAPRRAGESTTVPVTTAATEPSTSPPTTRQARPTTTDPAGSSERATEVVVATSEAPDTSTPSTTVAEEAECGPVVALADAVTLAGGIDFALPWTELQASIVASSGAAADSYRAVLAVAPPGVDDDLERLAAYNLAIGDAATRSASLTAFQAAVVAPDDALLDATAEVDRFMRATCSIGLTPD